MQSPQIRFSALVALQELPQIGQMYLRVLLGFFGGIGHCDPFAGGGAIPLEAMRLGCEVTAVDINPVAWFVLKCTLEYPQKLAGQKRPLTEFSLQDVPFLTDYFKARGLKVSIGCKQLDHDREEVACHLRRL